MIFSEAADALLEDDTCSNISETKIICPQQGSSPVSWQTRQFIWQVCYYWILHIADTWLNLKKRDSCFIWYLSLPWNYISWPMGYDTINHATILSSRERGTVSAPDIEPGIFTKKTFYMMSLCFHYIICTEIAQSNLWKLTLFLLHILPRQKKQGELYIKYLTLST